MKKILSLALALLMMLPLATGIAAGNIYYGGSTKDYWDEEMPTSEFKSILDYWKWLQENDKSSSDYGKYGKYIERSWTDACPTCKKSAFYYVQGGKVYCSCPTDGTIDVTSKYVDPSEKYYETFDGIKHTKKSCTSKDVYFTYDEKTEKYRVECKNCGEYTYMSKKEAEKLFDGVTYYDTFAGIKHTEPDCDYSDITVGTYKNGKYQTHCSNCGEDGYITSEYWDGWYDDDDYEDYFGISHKYSRCSFKDVTFKLVETGYYKGNYYRWECDNCGNSGYISVSDWNNYWNNHNHYYDYDIRVICTRGGDYTIDGSSSADYGDTRTIKFTPDYGYVLSEVTVNGESYGCRTTLTLTVKSDITVRAYFVRESSLKNVTFTSTSTGNGSVKAFKNNTLVSSEKFTAKYSDDVTFKFIPGGKRYSVSDVRIDGKSVGAVSSYTFENGLTKDHKVDVTFKWNCPYSDVKSRYMNAVEYVTEAGIMGYFNRYINKNAFCGTKLVSVKGFTAALAEMADSGDKLNSVADRIKWAEKNGILDPEDDYTVACDVQTACGIVARYLEVLEDRGNISFDDFDRYDTAKENAISIGMVSATTYKNNRNLTRYDLASVCYLISNLDY